MTSSSFMLTVDGGYIFYKYFPQKRCDRVMSVVMLWLNEGSRGEEEMSMWCGSFFSGDVW